MQTALLNGPECVEGRARRGGREHRRGAVQVRWRRAVREGERDRCRAEEDVEVGVVLRRGKGVRERVDVGRSRRCGREGGGGEGAA